MSYSEDQRHDPNYGADAEPDDPQPSSSSRRAVLPAGTVVYFAALTTPTDCEHVYTALGGCIESDWCVKCGFLKNRERRERAPDFWRCTTCGCFWRDNHDNTVSLANQHEKSCEACEWNPSADVCEPLFATAALDAASLMPAISELSAASMLDRIDRIMRREDMTAPGTVEAIQRVLWPDAARAVHAKAEGR